MYDMITMTRQFLQVIINIFLAFIVVPCIVTLLVHSTYKLITKD